MRPLPLLLGGWVLFLLPLLPFVGGCWVCGLLLGWVCLGAEQRMNRCVWWGGFLRVLTCFFVSRPFAGFLLREASWELFWLCFWST